MFVGLLVFLIRNGTPSRRQVDSEHGYMMFEFDKSCVYILDQPHTGGLVQRTNGP